jgi:hypothetical protein
MALRLSARGSAPRGGAGTEPRPGVLRAQSDRACALSGVGKPARVPPGLELVRNHDVNALLAQRRKLVEDELGRVPRRRGCCRDGGEQLGHEAAAPAGAHEAEAHLRLTARSPGGDQLGSVVRACEACVCGQESR